MDRHLTDEIAAARDLLRSAERAVALTGAGISTPSGIPDFRSADGLWTQTRPHEVASRNAFEQAPERFYDWFRPLLRMILSAKPNAAHVALAQLELAGRLAGVVTQNIDGLHRAAGSKVLYQLHGHLGSATCIRCEYSVPTAPLIKRVLNNQVPRCWCGGTFKPDVVLFGDELPRGLFWLAKEAIQTCDLLLVIGSSLEVEPCASLPFSALNRRSGTRARIISINYAETWLDQEADIVLRGDVVEVLPELLKSR